MYGQKGKLFAPVTFHVFILLLYLHTYLYCISSFACIRRCLHSLPICIFVATFCVTMLGATLFGDTVTPYGPVTQDMFSYPCSATHRPLLTVVYLNA